MTVLLSFERMMVNNLNTHCGQQITHTLPHISWEFVPIQLLRE